MAEPVLAASGRKTAFASCLVVVALAVSVGGEPRLQEQSQVPPRFTAGVEVVRMDVGVLDARRRPVRGLTTDDFEITVDGVHQPVVAVSEMEAAGTVVAKSANWTGLGAHVATNAIDDARTFLIILDDILLIAERDVATAREIARSVVDQLGPHDLAAVIFSRDNRRAQDFTQDQELLYAAVDTVKGGTPLSGASARSLAVLRNAMQVMSSMPARRSSIVYITPGPLVARRAIGSIDSDKGNNGEVSVVEHVQALTRQGVLANVRIYPFSTRGLSVYGGRQESQERQERTALLQAVARQTGGRATVDNNAPQQQVAQMFAENDFYYLVGYRPTYPSSDGRMRRLQIAVTRPGLTVVPSTRYFEADKSSDARASSDSADAPVATALSGLLPKTELPLRLLVEPIGPDTSGPAAPIRTAIRLGIETIPDAEPLRAGERFAIETRVFDGEGRKEIAVQSVIGQAVLSSQASLEVPSEVVLRPGRYNVRVAVRREADGRTGGVYGTVLVPPYGARQLTVSDPRIETSGNSGDRLVTTRRAFAAGVPLAIAVSVYRGDALAPAPVHVALRIEDAAATVKATRTETLPAGAPQHVTPRYDIDTSTWPAGAYLVTMTVTRATERPIERKLVLDIRRN